VGLEFGTAWLPFLVVPAPLRRLVRSHRARSRAGARVWRAAIAATGVAIAAVASLAGCGLRADEPRDRLDPDTARFTYGDGVVEVPLTACGREGDVVVMGGTAGAIVLQAEADVGDGGFDRTGVTVDLGDDGILGAFGAAMAHGPAGEIHDVRVEGDRLIVEGTWVSFDDQLKPLREPGGAAPEIAGKLVARCPETDDEDEVAFPASRRHVQLRGAALVGSQLPTRPEPAGRSLARH
jgi:hypothetical protein